jgi:uncharacterized SAM-binding protein YcdF (DUF218 family)
MDDVFFVLSKIGWLLLSPINIIVLFVSVGSLALLLNRISLAKWLLFPTTLLTLALLIYPIGDYVMNPLESRFNKPIRLPSNIDGIIVLGGGEELKLSVDWNTAEMGAGGDRYIAAAILAKQYPEAPVIFSGGSGLLNSPVLVREASIAKRLLTAVGISPNRLILESESRNTYENFSNLTPLIPNRTGKYLLITSAYHMPRAVGIARHFALDVIPYPVDYRANTEEFRQYDFNLFEHLQVLEPAWREWIGLTVYYLTGKTSSWFPQP